MSEGFQDTEKQQEIMRLVLGAADDGAFIFLQELQARLSYGAEVTNPAIQCSMRILERRGMVSRERVGRRTRYIPTLKAYQRYRDR